jgi:hypothetical protein
MIADKLSKLSVAQKSLIVVSTLLMLVLCFGVLSLVAPSGKDASSVAKVGGAGARSNQQIQAGLGVVTPLQGASNSAAGTNKGTGDTARPESTPKESTEQPQGSSANAGSLAISPTKTKLATVAAAENQAYTSDGRLFVTGNNGIFEIITTPSGDVSVVERTPKQNCNFGGIVEAKGTLYVNCSASGATYIYAAAVTATPSFKRIYTFKSAILPNGLTADDAGRLYVASTFLGQILRLTPSASNPLTFVSTGVWLDGTGPATNGIKFYDGLIYWSDSAFVNRVAIKADGTPGKQARVFSLLTIFDDLTVGSDGILIADFTGGMIRGYDLSGNSTGAIHASFAGPSSVAKARAPFPAGALIVTEKNANQVTLVTP